MDATHTPGPWGLNTQHAEIEVRGPQESGVLIATMSHWGDAAEGHNPQPANASLIAAAPDLLALAERCKEYLQHPDGHHLPAGEWFDLNAALHAAIAKATGG